jgi:hypothetical protein
MGKWIESFFSKEEIEMVKKHKKNWSTFLAIKEMQIKTTVGFHLTPVRMAIIKSTNNNKCWQGCAKKEHLYTARVNVN